jgi:hypothetical protein
MKRMFLGLAVTLTFALGLCFVFSQHKVAGQDKPDVRSQLPAGNWTLSVTPQMRVQSTVDLYSVTTDATKGLGVTKIGLRNLSDKDIAAVKVGWRLFLKDQPESSLLRGETPLLGASLAPGEWRVIHYPVVKFIEAVTPLMIENRVKGNYRIELFVTEAASSAEVTKSVNSQHGKMPFIKVSSEPDDATATQCRLRARQAASTQQGFSFIKASMWTAPAAQCQDQICQWDGSCWICNGAVKMGCRVDSCTSCTNTRCQDQGD